MKKAMFIATIMALMAMPVISDDSGPDAETRLSGVVTSFGPAIQMQQSFRLPTGLAIVGKVTLVQGACSLSTDNMGDIMASCSDLPSSPGTDSITAISGGIGYVKDLENFDITVTASANWAAHGGDGINPSVEVELCRDNVCLFGEYHDTFAGVEVAGYDLGDFHVGFGYRF